MRHRSRWFVTNIDEEGQRRWSTPPQHGAQNRQDVLHSVSWANIEQIGRAISGSQHQTTASIPKSTLEFCVAGIHLNPLSVMLSFFGIGFRTHPTDRSALWCVGKFLACCNLAGAQLQSVTLTTAMVIPTCVKTCSLDDSPLLSTRRINPHRAFSRMFKKHIGDCCKQHHQQGPYEADPAHSQAVTDHT